MKIIGIDPGLTGAFAVIDQTGMLIHVGDLPVMRLQKLSWIDGQHMQSLLLEHAQVGVGDIRVCVVERAQGMPKQGVSSSFNYGVGFGSILSIVQSLSIPLHFVRPAEWKQGMQLGGAKERNRGGKAAALCRARLLWPTAELHLQKHHGRAEALLIAEFFRSRM